MIDKEVDLFNLMVLPQDAEHDAATVASLWGPASVFCQQRRAFLLMDAPAVAGSEWNTVQDALGQTPGKKGINDLRIGLVKDYSAIFYPRLTISENGVETKVEQAGPSQG